MRIRVAAIIGMIMLVISSALPVCAAETGGAAGGLQYAGARQERTYYGTISPNAFRGFGNGWHYREGNWYYVRNGKAVSGWVKDNGKWYFLGGDGKMKTGWIMDNGKWYYLASGGAMKTGWVKDNGKWYYLASNGVMKTGWLKLGDRTYYLRSGGARATGWLKIKGKKYYFRSNGVLDTKKTKEANTPPKKEAEKAAATDTVTSTAQTAKTATSAEAPAKAPETTQATAPAKAPETTQAAAPAKAAETKKAAASAPAQKKVKTKGELVAEYALKFVGNPYVYGGCSLTKGTDCSGFVMLIYRHFGITLPHYDAAIRSKGKRVSSLEKAKAGDIICYYGHVAIYLGDGRIVHASNSRDGIKISERADYRTIAGIRRIFD